MLIIDSHIAIAIMLPEEIGGPGTACAPVADATGEDDRPQRQKIFLAKALAAERAQSCRSMS